MRRESVQYVFAWDTNNIAYGTDADDSGMQIHTARRQPRLGTWESGNRKEFREIGGYCSRGEIDCVLESQKVSTGKDLEEERGKY